MASSTWSVNECLRRIRDVLVIDDDFGLQCHTDTELCKLLADGEKLCCLLCVLSDGSISPENDGTVCFYSENSQILAKRNVKFFLENCSQYLRVKREDLFEPEDLLELRKPHKVMSTIQKLLDKSYQMLVIRRKSELPFPISEESAQGITQNVINELCETEKQLIEKLRKLHRFKLELRGLLSLWSEELLEHTFRYLDELLWVHEGIDKELSRLAEGGALKFCLGIGKQFSTAKVQLAVYGKYFCHYSLARMRLEKELKAKPQLKEQVHLLERHFAVDSFYLIYDSPLRRMFNYSTLLDRLLVTVKKEIPEAASSVEEAVNECKSLLNYYNECKRSSEKAATTQSLLQSINELPVELSSLQEIGMHRGDGNFRVKRGLEREKDCFCLLTDRQIIVASASGMKFRFSVPISEQLALDYGPLEPVSGASNSMSRNFNGYYTRGSRVFKIEHDGVTVTFNSRNASDLGKWGQLVTKAKAFNFPKGWNTNGHRFQLRTFRSESESSCTRCNEVMLGVACQGYHCDHCDMRLDPECFISVITTQRPPSYLDGTSQNRSDPVDCQFFHGTIDRGTAESRLPETGSFLVRESKSNLVLSIRWESKCFHMIIEQSASFGVETKYSLDIKGTADISPVWHASLDQMVAHYRVNRLKVGDVMGVSLLAGVPSTKSLARV